MDALARGRNVLLSRAARATASVAAGAAALAATACSPAPGPAVGVSHGPAPVRPAASTDGGAPRGPSPIPKDLAATFTKLPPERFVSQGHAGARFEMDVWANAAAKEALAKPAGDYPVGAMFVAEHWERQAPGTRGPVMMMERREKGWRWVTVSASGEVKRDGAIESCAACHEEAARDSVFPLPPPPK